MHEAGSKEITDLMWGSFIVTFVVFFIIIFFNSITTFVVRDELAGGRKLANGILQPSL